MAAPRSLKGAWTLCHWAIKEYFARHPNGKPGSLSNSFPGRPVPPEIAPEHRDKPSYDKRLLDVNQLSEYLSLPKATIYTWVSLRRIPPGAIVRLGRSLRFDRKVIDSWVEEHKTQRG